MTTVDEARRRSTDEILGQAMEDSGNGDGKKVSEGGRPLHFDSLGGLAMHRAANRPTDYDAGKSLAEAGMGKLAGASVDALVDKAVSGMASAGARGFAGASWQITSIGALAYHLYTEGYEKPHREKDRQLSLGASDAGVVGLAQALPFDASFKRAITTSHAGSSGLSQKPMPT